MVTPPPPIHGPFRLKVDRRRISPIPESGQAVSNLPDPLAESCRYLAHGKTVDCSILRPEPQDSPRTVSTGGQPLQKHSKNPHPHDTNVAFGMGTNEW